MKRLWLPLTYLSFKKAGESVRGHFDFLKWFTRLIADGDIDIPAPTITTVTKAEADILITNSALVVGQNYKITGVDVSLYGGTDIILTAVLPDKFSIEGQGIFYNPKYNQSSAWRNIGFRVWRPTSSYAVGAKAIWAGMEWLNKTGAVGTAPSRWTLDLTNWEVIPYNSTDYNIAVDKIEYDIVADRITRRADAYGNDVMCSNEAIIRYSDPDNQNYQDKGGNPLRVFQWGNGRYSPTASYDDDFQFYGTWGNKIENALVDNMNFDGFNFINNEFRHDAKLKGTTDWQNCQFQGNVAKGKSGANDGPLIEDNNFAYVTVDQNILTSYGEIYGNTRSGTTAFTIAKNYIGDGAIAYNVLNAGSILSNKIQGAITYNTFTYYGVISGNILSGYSTINYNTFSVNYGFISGNHLLNSHITYNTIAPTGSQGATIRSNILQNTTITRVVLNQTAHIQNNHFIKSTLDLTTTSALASKSIDNCTFQGVAITENLTAATIIYGTYARNVFGRLDGTKRISYVNNSDVQIITAVTT